MRRKIVELSAVPFLNTVPLNPRMCYDSDEGTPFIIHHPDSTCAKAFMEIISKVEKQICPSVERERNIWPSNLG